MFYSDISLLCLTKGSNYYYSLQLNMLLAAFSIYLENRKQSNANDHII